MTGLAILLLYHFAGIVLKQWLHVPLPANVIGLILFTASLFLGIIKLEWVEKTANFFVRHMMLFFLPYVVGTIILLRYIEVSELISVALTLLLSTFATLLATGWIVRIGKKGGEDTHAGSR